MARTLYGRSAADYLVSPAGAPLPGVTVTVWDSLTGGLRITDLLDLTLSPISAVTSDAQAFIAFYGPDGLFDDLFMDGGGDRVAVRPLNLAQTVSNLADAITAIQAQPHFVFSTTPPSDTTALWIPSGN